MSIAYDTVISGLATGLASGASVVARVWDGTSFSTPASTTVGTVIETAEPGEYICRITYPDGTITSAVIPSAVWTIGGNTYVDPQPRAATGSYSLLPTIVVNGSNQPVLTWTFVPGAVNYQILRWAAKTGTPTAVANITAPTVTYTDTSPLAGTSYYSVVATF